MKKALAIIALIFFSQFTNANCYSESATKEARFTSCIDAAVNGDIDAQVNVGLIYFLGEGTPENKSLALSWLEIAANQGNAKAQWFIGSMYEHGDVGDTGDAGVNVDYAKMLYWYHLANEQGFLSATADLARIYEEGIGTSIDLSKAQTLYYTAADGGVADARYRVGKALVFGQWGDTDIKTGMSYLQMASVQGDAASQFLLGLIHQKGFDTETGVNLITAQMYLQQAAEQNYPTAIKQLAEVQLEILKASNTTSNIEYPPCYDKSAADLENFSNCAPSAAQGDPNSQFLIAQLYAKSSTNMYDPIKAFKWFLKSANGGHSEAMKEVALSYESGIGVEKDLSRSTYWYDKAIQAGANIPNSVARSDITIAQGIASRMGLQNNSAETGSESPIKPDSNWEISVDGDFVRFFSRGSVVNGHTFGFVKKSGFCTDDILYISWSTYERGIEDYVDQDATLDMTVGKVNFQLDVPISSTHQFGPINTLVTLSNFMVHEKFIDLLQTDDVIDIQISGSNSLADMFDLKSDTFSLIGHKASRSEALKLCNSIN